MFICVAVACALVVASVFAGTAPEQINYQAKVEANGVPFDGVGQFKFAIIDQSGTNTYWSNDGTSTSGSAPAAAVALVVRGGILNVMLGNAAIPNMTVLPAAVLLHPDTWLRMWFGGSTGTTFERLTPDSKLASVPYAQVAETVPDASIHGKKLARESVWPQHEGRPSDCIVTYFGQFTDDTLTNIAIPTNKNFIITDVVYGSVSSDVVDNPTKTGQSSVIIQYEKDGKQTVLLKQQQYNWGRGTDFSSLNSPVTVSLRSGLAVPAGAVLKFGAWSFATVPQSITISGFEIPVE